MHRSEDRGGKTAQMTVTLLLGGMLSLGIVLLVLLIGAAAVSGGVLKESMAPRITVIACVLGCLLGGFFVCCRCATGRFLAGAGTGAISFALILCVGFMMGDGPEMGMQALIELAACVCGGALAGFFSKKRKKGRRTAARAK